MDERAVNRGLHAAIDVAVGEFRLQLELVAAPGETVAVVGPNGAGKSTLLRVLAGLAAVDAGRIMLGGTVVDDPGAGQFVPAESRSVGVVFQDHVLFPHLTALDNVAFGLRARGASPSVARRQAGTWLDRMGLADHARSKPAELSGGQAQRVALARALAIDPAILLLDEPLSALDATTRMETRRQLAQHLRDHDGVRVVVTHDPVDAAALADRIVVLEAGRAVQDGSLADIAARPRSRYAADLVGVNLLRGRARHGRVDVGEVTLIVADDVDGDVLLTIPPRAVALSPVPPTGAARNVWSGKVDGAVHDHHRARIRIRGPVTIVAEITHAAATELRLVEGADVWVSVKATEITVSPA